MTDVTVEQRDEVIAKQIVKRLMRAAISEIGQYEAIAADLVARHRQAAEKAQQERDAGIAYRVCAETRHVTLGDKVATAIRSQGHE